MALTKPTKLGAHAKLYYNTGTRPSPVWNEIKGAHGVSVDDGESELDSTSRRDGGYKTSVPGLFDLSVEFKMFDAVGDDDLDALLDARAARTALEVLVLPGPYNEAGHEGHRFYAHVFGGKREEDDDGLIVREFKFKPAPSEYPPERYVSAAPPP